MKRWLTPTLELPLGFVQQSADTQTTIEPTAQKQIETGIIEGVFDKDKKIEKYLGIPYAKPPVAELRWRRPEPIDPWEGILETKEHGNIAMQYKFSRWVQFDEKKLSEDCLYLNVWTPANSDNKKLPVVVKFHGGGLMVGSSGMRDLSYMAAKGVVVVSPNYRLNIFGFFAHPELSAEDEYGVSGNYGFLDQLLALQWVKNNISVFGGDPDRITIEGESAGAISVNAHMSSPLSKDLIIGAIATSGGLVRPMPTLKEAEAHGKNAAEEAGYTSLESLRAASAQEILEFYKKAVPQTYWPIIDGYFLPNNISKKIQAGEQAQIPLMIGWNSAEMPVNRLMKSDDLTKANFVKRTEELYGEYVDSILNMFPHENASEIERSAVDLGSIDFQDYNTWKWFDLHRKNSDQPVYRFLFSRVVPPSKNTDLTTYKPLLGAGHGQDVPYAWGTIVSDSLTNFQKTDYQLSELMQQYYFNFIKNGDPNGDSLPKWPSVEVNSKTPLIMNFDVKTGLIKADMDYRYQFFDQIYQGKTHWVK
jgi:para-nitrobenzyl esterase